MSRRRIAALAAAIAAPAAVAQSAAGTESIGSIDLSTLALSLAGIVGLIFAAAYVVRRLPLGLAARGSGPLKLVATLPLGPRERLMLVTSQGREILVGVSPAGVSIAQVAPASPSQSAAAIDTLPVGDAVSLARGFGAEDARP